MRTLVEVPRFSALDIKKIANMNPSKRSGPAINKKADLHKIAKMFKHVIQETTEDLLCSDKSDGAESSMDEEMENFIKMKLEIQEKVMPS